MGYTLKDRKELSKTFARPSEISRYRALLKTVGSKLAGTLLSDKEALARMLYYELLGYYSVEEIEAGASTASESTTPSPIQTAVASAATAGKELKKKLTNSLSTLISAGKTLIIRKSDSQTASSPTASTVTANSKK